MLTYSLLHRMCSQSVAHALYKQHVLAYLGMAIWTDPVYGVYKVGRCSSQYFGLWDNFQGTVFVFKYIMALFLFF